MGASGCSETSDFAELVSSHSQRAVGSLWQEALKLGDPANPDPAIVSKIGKTFAQTHDYKQAIEYYNDTLKRLQDRKDAVAEETGMRRDLAELYVRLHRRHEAIAEIERALAACNTDSPSDLKRRIDLQIFLAEVARCSQVGRSRVSR